MLIQLKKNKGFTLVEVIVVAVIVAVLALVAIQLYRGYVADSRTNTAENLAASAAGYCHAEANRGCVIATQNVLAQAQILVTGQAAAGVTITTFICPANADLVVTAGVAGPPVVPGTVVATVGGAVSQGIYNW